MVTGTWAAGGGIVPNAADYAMFEMADRGVLPPRIGSVTGFLGWQTLSLNPNHTKMLGYPCNFDNCQQMHQVDAGAFRNTSPNNVKYGLPIRGVAQSGGPWVQNFGTASVGQDGGANPGMNRVVAVTSYGYVSTDPKAQGASVPDTRWVRSGISSAATAWVTARRKRSRATRDFQEDRSTSGCGPSSHPHPHF